MNFNPFQLQISSLFEISALCRTAGAHAIHKPRTLCSLGTEDPGQRIGSSCVPWTILKGVERAKRW